MKLIAKLIMVSVFLLPLVLIVVLMQVIEDEPKLHGRADLTANQIALGKQVVEENNPRRMKPGAIAKINLGQEELDLAVNYIAHQYPGGIASVAIDQGQVLIESTLKLPANPFGRFLNLTLKLKQTESLPQIDSLMLGKLSVPVALADSLLNYGLSKIQPLADWQTFAGIIKNVEFDPQQVIVSYRWQNDLPAKLRGLLLSPKDQERVEIYQRHLTELTQTSKSSLNLTELTQPLFQLAEERSVISVAEAENRALILVLAFYVNRKDFHNLIPQSKAWPRPAWRTVLLNGRDDFPKHYLVSAMLAAYSGTPLSDAVGLFKELEDSRGGSGFSFNDIAADRAGTRMGESAVSTLRAKRIQGLMATAQERDMMPVTIDLPEFMPEAEFMRRFGGIEGVPYRQMMEKIEHRVGALPVNQD